MAAGAATSEYQKAPNVCIYCGSPVYSKKPGIRRHPLGGEHIVAEGLGGTLELPLSSCQECEEKTGALVENDVLRRTLKALRVHLNLKKKRGPPPKTLPLQAKIGGHDMTLDIPVQDYPIIFFMPALAPPSIVGSDGTPQTVGARIVSIKHDAKELFRKYRIESFASPHWDIHAFSQMLAKIGHALAVAELGKSFTPRLTDLIRHGDLAATKFIGGLFDWIPERPSTALHELTVGYQKISKTTYVVVRVRLFAKFDGPTTVVIVGESLEQPSARLRRVFSYKKARARWWLTRKGRTGG